MLSLNRYAWIVVMLLLAVPALAIWDGMQAHDNLVAGYWFFRVNDSGTKFYDTPDINHNLTLYGKNYNFAKYNESYYPGTDNFEGAESSVYNYSGTMSLTDALDAFNTSTSDGALWSAANPGQYSFWNINFSWEQSYVKQARWNLIFSSNVVGSGKTFTYTWQCFNKVTLGWDTLGSLSCSSDSGECASGAYRNYKAVTVPSTSGCLNASPLEMRIYIVATGGAPGPSGLLWDVNNITWYKTHSNLTAHYKMNGDVVDASYGQYFNLTNNGVTFKDGIIGQYGYFDGTTYATYSGFPSLGNAATISAWAYDDSSVSDYPMIIRVGNAIRLYKQQAIDTMWCSGYNNTGTAIGVSLGVETTNAINHYACVYNGSHLISYKNGNYVNSGYLGLLNQSSQEFNIGTITGNYWKGGIDDVRIYSSTLSAAEIKTLYDSTRPPMLQSGDGLNFSGLGSHVNSSGKINLSTTNKVSVEAYINTSLGASWQIIAELSPNLITNIGTFSLNLNPSGNVYASIKGDVGLLNYKVTGNNFGEKHIVAVYDMSASPDSIKIYVNGIESQVLESSADNTENFSAYPIYLGHRGTQAYYLNGTIKLVRIYNRTLTQDEVNFLYAQAREEIVHGQCGVDYGCHEPVFNFTYHDEINGSVLNVTSSAVINSVDWASNGSIINFQQMEYCQSLPKEIYNSTWNFSGSIDTDADGYLTRVFTIDAGQPYLASVLTPYVYPLYLIPTDNSSTIIFTWLTTQYQPISGVMEIYRCEANGTKVPVESVNILGGNAVANLQLLYQSYAYAVIHNGVRYEDDSFSLCHTEGSTTRTYYVNVQPINYTPAIGLFLIDCELSKVGDNMVTMRWSSNQESAGQVEGCIVALRSDIYNQTEIYRNCSNSSTYSMTRTIPSDGNSYTVIGELHQGSRTGYCKNSVSFYIPAHQGGSFGVTALLGILILVMTINLIYHWENDLQVFLSLLGIVIGIFLGLVLVSWQWFIGIAAFIIIIVMIARSVEK